MGSNKKTNQTAVKAENIGTLFNFVERSKDIVQNNEVMVSNVYVERSFSKVNLIKTDCIFHFSN